MLSCLQRRDILLEGSVARTSQTFPMVSISQVRQHIFEIIFLATVLICPDAGDILIGDSHGNKFHVVVFANDGSLLGEFECPHVKVGVYFTIYFSSLFIYLSARCPDVVVSRLQVRDMWSPWPRTITMFLSSTLFTLLESTNPPSFFRKINILHRLILFFETCAKRRKARKLFSSCHDYFNADLNFDLICQL